MLLRRQYLSLFGVDNLAGLGIEEQHGHFQTALVLHQFVAVHIVGDGVTQGSAFLENGRERAFQTAANTQSSDGHIVVDDTADTRTLLCPGDEPVRGVEPCIS